MNYKIKKFGNVEKWVVISPTFYYIKTGSWTECVAYLKRIGW